MSIFPAGSSLIDIITRAKAMQGKTSAPVPAQPAQKSIEDQVTISPQLQDKINASKKVNGYLQVFSAALKFINSGKKLPDLAPYLDKINNGSARSSGKIDTKI